MLPAVIEVVINALRSLIPDTRANAIAVPIIDLLQYYTPFQHYLKQEKQSKVSEEVSLFFQDKDIDIQEYISLLEKLLLLEYENNGDLQFIYSVVKSNINKLDIFFCATFTTVDN